MCLGIKNQDQNSSKFPNKLSSLHQINTSFIMLFLFYFLEIIDKQNLSHSPHQHRVIYNTTTTVVNTPKAE